MKLLWNRDLKMNTVHVLDVARAIWHLYYHGKTKEIYNLADKSDTSKYPGSRLQRVGILLSNLHPVSNCNVLENNGYLANTTAFLCIRLLAVSTTRCDVFQFNI